jgi:hypothetical protein
MARKRLAGDQISDAMRAAGGKQASPLDERERSGATDPQSIAEFLAYDIPFRTEPAINVFMPPPENDRE